MSSIINNIKVGTVTAMYNVAPYVGECIDSLLQQSRKPNIITLIDDCSTDGSFEVVVDKLSKLSDFNEPVSLGPCFGYKWKIQGVDIVLFKKAENSGPAATRNIGLRYLLDKTSVIFIADSDDIYYKDKIKKSLEIFDKYRFVGLVYSDYDNFHVANNTLVREFKEPFSLARLSQECIVSNNSAFATSMISKIGLYDESLFGPEDYDLWLRLAENCAVYHIPEALYKYRITGNNITVTTPSERFAQHVYRVHEKARQRNAAKIQSV